MRKLFCVLAAAIAWQAPAMPASAVSAVPSFASEQDCGDLLARIGKRPSHLNYAGCAYRADRQGKPLRATYRVSGRFAAPAEAYLIRSTRLNRLRRSCCQWDAPPRQFTDASGREYMISMLSDETVVTSRKAWPHIRRFEVIVETLTEEI